MDDSSVEVAVVGAGLMGHGIAQVLSSQPGSVWLYDVTDEALEGAARRIRANFDLLIRHGLCSQEKADERIDRIRPTRDLKEAVSHAWFAIEAATENLDLKQEIFADLESAVSEGTILATNTSSYTLLQCGERVRRKERLVGSHFFMPAQIIPLVEVSRGEATADAVMDRTFELWESCGKAPIRVQKDVHGYIGNRLQAALTREAFDLLAKGVASADDIDLAVQMGFGLRFLASGPLEQRDLAGLGVHYRVMEQAYPDLNRDTEPTAIVAEMLKRGESGLDAGKGFFDWSGEDPEGVRSDREEKLVESMAKLGLWKPMR